LLDGFPRTVPQAEALDRMLAARGRSVKAVLLLEVPTEVLVERLSGRETCPVCQTPYGKDSPSKVPGICDREGAGLVMRPDDMPEKVRQRLNEYETKTSLLTGYYKARGVLRAVDGVGSVDEVEQRIVKALSDEPRN
jgi:adenylate kinase